MNRINGYPDLPVSRPAVCVSGGLAAESRGGGGELVAVGAAEVHRLLLPVPDPAMDVDLAVVRASVLDVQEAEATSLYEHPIHTTVVSFSLSASDAGDVVLRVPIRVGGVLHLGGQQRQLHELRATRRQCKFN